MPTPAGATRSPPASSSSDTPTRTGSTPQRPLVASGAGPGRYCLCAPDDPRRRDLGMNGSYLVFRQLSQDVPAFWRYIDEKTRRADGHADPEARCGSPRKMVGRWPSGAPLVKSPDEGRSGASDDNDFLFTSRATRTASNVRSASHIRRTNPRDSLDPDPGSDRSIEVGKRHRVLSRGRAVRGAGGKSMDIAEISAAGDAPWDRGLHFICFNTHIGRQFEFIQNSWINNPKFDGLYEDDDPLWAVAARARRPGGVFTIQASQSVHA